MSDINTKISAKRIVSWNPIARKYSDPVTSSIIDPMKDSGKYTKNITGPYGNASKSPPVSIYVSQGDKVGSWRNELIKGINQSI